MKHLCKQCGKCCIKYPDIYLYPEELMKWKDYPFMIKSNYGFYPPLNFVFLFTNGDYADLWSHPITGEELGRCPFLRKENKKTIYICLLESMKTGLKPQICKDYPADDFCEGNIDWGKSKRFPECPIFPSLHIA